MNTQPQVGDKEIMDNNLAAKSARAEQLIASLGEHGWTTPEFWEANQILRSTRDADMDPTLVALLILWSDIESDRIACGENEPCNPRLDAALEAMWPTIPHPYNSGSAT